MHYVCLFVCLFVVFVCLLFLLFIPLFAFAFDLVLTLFCFFWFAHTHIIIDTHTRIHIGRAAGGRLLTPLAR